MKLSISENTVFVSESFKDTIILMAVEINSTKASNDNHESTSPMLLSNSRDEFSAEQDVGHSIIIDENLPVANSTPSNHDVHVDKSDKNLDDNIVDDDDQSKNERSLFVDVDIIEGSPEKSVCMFGNPDDPYKLTNDTRNLGLIVARGSAVVTIGPMDGMEQIANPFVAAE
uniref:Uncharacterized protein n=1 Tax=Romanomermis culicivorax TaxID=13658 RepID=A0A915I7S3_ROMCU